MYARVATVEALADYFLALTFTNGEQKLFDVKPYLARGIFTRLKDEAVFGQVKLFNGSVLWPGNLDLCPDTLYEDSLEMVLD